MEKEALEFILKKIVDKPQDVFIEIDNNNNNFSIIKFKVSKDDLGKVIGKQGRVIKAIRVFMSAMVKKEEKEFRLELMQ